MDQEDKRVFDIKSGQPLPRLVRAFLGRRLKILPEDILHRAEFAVKIRTVYEPATKHAVSPLAELVDLEEQQQLLEMKNLGVTHLVRVHRIDFV